jgi:hypothetical protein
VPSGTPVRSAISRAGRSPQNGLALELRQARYRRPQSCGAVASLGPLVRSLDVRRVRLHGLRQAIRRASRGAVGPGYVERTAAGHEREVAAQLAAALVEAVGVEPEPEEDVLDDVLGLRRITEHSVGVRVDAA